MGAALPCAIIPNTTKTRTDVYFMHLDIPRKEKKKKYFPKDDVKAAQMITTILHIIIPSISGVKKKEDEKIDKRLASIPASCRFSRQKAERLMISF